MVTSGDFCVYGNKLPSYIRGLEFLDLLRYCVQVKLLLVVTFHIINLGVTEGCNSVTLQHLLFSV